MKSWVKKILDWDVDKSAALRLEPGQGRWWNVAVFLAHSGDSWWWLAALFPIWLAGIWLSPTWHRASGVLAFSLLLEAVIVLAIKFLIRRKRPDGDWGEIYRSTDPHSFPSGHAARMVLIAVVSWAVAPLWFSLLLLLWAPLVCVARVITGVHYLSDVIAGVVIGLISGGVMVVWLPTLIPLVNSYIPFAF
ncbi:MAG: phosphatase PAP2 family protein [Anaerolineae bacterium]|nr:phosphatase PAP2 family protein [Anaerolineae bacterium]